MNETSYLSETLSKTGKIVRWHENFMPLNVYVAPFYWYKAQYDALDYYQLVEKALMIWSEGSEGKVTFSLVDNITDAHIKVFWRRVTINYQGLCTWTNNDFGMLTSAKIDVGLSDGIIQKEYQDKQEVLRIIIHEFGHAIGLFEHSPNTKDIMTAKIPYGLTSLSERDKKTINLLYSFPCGTLQNEIVTDISRVSNDNSENYSDTLKVDLELMANTNKIKLCKFNNTKNI